MQRITIQPMSISAEAVAARRRDEQIVLRLIASFVLSWVVVAGCVCLQAMQHAADLAGRV